MNRRAAFTLAELLVGLAVTSVLATLLLGIVSATMNVWQQGRNYIDTFASSRQVLARIADELGGAIASATPIVEFSENVPSLADTTAPVPGTSENVFFVASYPNSKAGDLCVIAYRHDSITYELQRAFLNSEDAWTGVTKYQADGYASVSALSWRTVARGVLEFEVRSFSQADLDSGNNSPATTWSSIGGTADMTGNVPRQIILRIKVIDDKALVRLKAAGANTTVTDRIKAQSAREFTANVSLLAPH